MENETKHVNYSGISYINQFKINNYLLINYEDKTTKKTHRVYKFNNGWGVSLVKGENCYGCTIPGCWSVVTIYWKSKNLHDYDLHVENPVCDGDVLWDVPDEQLDAILLTVKRLPEFFNGIFQNR